MLQYCQKNRLILTNEHRDFFTQHPWTIQALALRSSGQHVLRWISSNKHEAHAANICMLMWVCMATVTHFYWGNINLTSNRMVWTLFSSVRVQCDSVVLWKAERKVFRNELLLTEYVHCLSIICIHNRGNQQLFVLIKQSSAYFTWERKRSNVMLQTYCKCSHETYNIIIIIITQNYPLWASCQGKVAWWTSDWLIPFKQRKLMHPKNEDAYISKLFYWFSGCVLVLLLTSYSQ